MPVGAGFIPARIGENKKMTEHKKLQPEIRFAGFTDDWEQRKLGDVFGKIRNAFVGTATPYYVTSGHFYLESNNIKNGQINRDSEIFINEYFYQKQKDKWLKSGDMVMVQSGHVGHTAIIPDELHNSIAHALIMFTDYLDKSVPYFFNFFFQTNKAKREIDKITTGNTVKHILASDMKDFPIFLPSYEEQTQIGNFFKQLDDTIALHQRTLEKYQKLKISYLEKMFPKENELYPELRFPNFTDAWEQRKLGEVVERITRKNLNLESRLPLTISAQDGLISQTEFFDKQVASKNISGYYLIENGEFAYNKSYSNGYPWGAIKRLDKYKNGVLSTLYIVFKPIDVDSQFLVSYFDTTFWHSEIAEIAVEGARNHGLLNIPVMDFFRIKIKIPKSKEEQTQIGNFFKQLDDTIALHQREVEKYKKIKQSYLEKMFI